MEKECNSLDELNEFLAKNSYFICLNKDDENSLIMALNPNKLGMVKWHYNEDSYGLLFEMTKEEAKEMRDYLDTVINYHK